MKDKIGSKIFTIFSKIPGIAFSTVFTVKSGYKLVENGGEFSNLFRDFIADGWRRSERMIKLRVCGGSMINCMILRDLLIDILGERNGCH
jgi:hypothetical protein